MNTQQDVPSSAALATGRVLEQYLWVTSLTHIAHMMHLNQFSTNGQLACNCFKRIIIVHKWVTIMCSDKNIYIACLKVQCEIETTASKKKTLLVL